MFAIELKFKDSTTNHTEHILVRRPSILIGARDISHVVIEDLKNFEGQIRVVRDIGRKFRWSFINLNSTIKDNLKTNLLLENLSNKENFCEYSEKIDVGKVEITITSLDSDLFVKENEALDKIAVKVLRKVAVTSSPLYPAVLIPEVQHTIALSIHPDQQIIVGRSGECALRLDSSAVSAQHAKISFSRGSFWVEDLGSTNGTFVNGQQISGRTEIAPGIPITIGRETAIIGVINKEQLIEAQKLYQNESITDDEYSLRDEAPEYLTKGYSPQSSRDKRELRQEGSDVEIRNYPIVVSTSEFARPARLVLKRNFIINIGRDPSNEFWIGAPHISRKHCSVTYTSDGEITITDYSTNGTVYGDGILRKGDTLMVEGKPRVLDFRGGVTVAVCFTQEQEDTFIAAHGSPFTFSDTPSRTFNKNSAGDKKGNERSNSSIYIESSPRDVPSAKATGSYTRNMLQHSLGLLPGIGKSFQENIGKSDQPHRNDSLATKHGKMKQSFRENTFQSIKMAGRLSVFIVTLCTIFVVILIVTLLKGVISI
jgi:pSer/pThr/pTyr-binding forkhead associated (FHA) protein